MKVDRLDKAWVRQFNQTLPLSRRRVPGSYRCGWGLDDQAEVDQLVESRLLKREEQSERLGDRRTVGFSHFDAAPCAPADPDEAVCLEQAKRLAYRPTTKLVFLDQLGLGGQRVART